MGGRAAWQSPSLHPSACAWEKERTGIWEHTHMRLGDTSSQGMGPGVTEEGSRSALPVMERAHPALVIKRKRSCWMGNCREPSSWGLGPDSAGGVGRTSEQAVPRLQSPCSHFLNNVCERGAEGRGRGWGEVWT